MMILLLSFNATLLVGCAYDKDYPVQAGNSSDKGKQIVDCMDKGSPEDCDRKVNRRTRDY